MIGQKIYEQFTTVSTSTCPTRKLSEMSPGVTPKTHHYESQEPIDQFWRAVVD